MMLNKLLTAGLLLTVLTTQAQLNLGQLDANHVPIPVQHYANEYTFDTPSDLSHWKKQKQGLNAGYASTDILYLRSEVPSLTLPTWFETGWRGERLNTQILVWSPDSLSQIRVLLSNLTDGKGNSIASENSSVSLVRYVISNFPYAANEFTCDVAASTTAYLMPDRFESFDRFDLPGNSIRPVWLTLNIPENTPPGIYQGTVEVRSNKQSISLPLTITVQKPVLPKPEDWKFRLDLWQNPWVIAGYYQVEPWSPEHKALLKKHVKLYADAGGKFITTYGVHSPWSDNSYRIEGTMIEWIKRKDGTWKFDYTIFDEYVSLCMEMGVREAITLYTPVPWGYRFRYVYEATGNFEIAEWSPETPVFKEVWNVFLDDLKAHLEKKGWFEKTYLGINENPLDITKAAAQVIKDHSKRWKITYAGDWHAELSPLLDDYSVVISSEPSSKELKERQARGQTTTYYVCCTPPRPNNFVFSPPIEGRFLNWYTAAYGYDGFLRWAYDAWPEDPMRDARHTIWPAGDCFLVYPGGNSSIRYEKLRQGIVDFEKIRIVRDRVARSSDKKLKSQWKKFEDHLALFIDNPDYKKRDYSTDKLMNLVHTGNKMLAEISNVLPD
ncbi:MAG: glycoside hydrolase domain-containing protein [Cyclobacteriaceae bacterium]